MQTGSLHAVIIAVLFVALMATLGIVFYQNFIAKKEVVEKVDTSPETNLTTKRVAFDSRIYRLDYPDGWASKTEMIESSTAGGSVTTITNRTGDVQVSFSVSEQVPDTACDSNDGLKVSSYRANSTPVANLTDVPVYLVEALVDSQGGGYNYTIGLVPDSGATHSAVGDSRCNVKEVGLASIAIAGSDTLAKPTILAKISFPKLQPKEGEAIKNMKLIKDIMNTDDYKTAVEILESARKE